MKVKFKTAAMLACAAMCAFTMTACGDGSGKSAQTGNPSDPSGITSSGQKGEDVNNANPDKKDESPIAGITVPDRDNEGYKGFVNAAEDFAAAFAEYAYADYNKSENFTVSPVSVYMALSLAAECADGQTREELLSALGVSYEQLTGYFADFYTSLEVEHKGRKYDYETREEEEVTTGLLDLSNSVWINEGTEVKQNCLDRLSEYFRGESRSADFKNDNAAANEAVRGFVKENTRGLIDKDFKLSENTLITLINTLYLQTVWNSYGRDLEYTEESYDFRNSDGSETSAKLLKGYYRSGRILEDEAFKTFYAVTSNGYKLKFIVPKDGYCVGDVFTAENITKVNSVTDYKSIDSEAKKQYYTRCLFPEFKASYDESINKILADKFGLTSFFNESCNFSNLTDENVYCGQVRHVTELTVDKRGIEGAAVTLEMMAGAVGPMYEEVYVDFVIDGAFGFIITDRNDVTLFSGVVEKI